MPITTDHIIWWSHICNCYCSSDDDNDKDYLISDRRYSLRSVISYVLPLEKYSEVIFVFALPAVFFAPSEAASVGVPCALMLWTGHAR